MRVDLPKGISFLGTGSLTLLASFLEIRNPFSQSAEAMWHSMSFLCESSCAFPLSFFLFFPVRFLPSSHKSPRPLKQPDMYGGTMSRNRRKAMQFGIGTSVLPRRHSIMVNVLISIFHAFSDRHFGTDQTGRGGPREYKTSCHLYTFVLDSYPFSIPNTSIIGYLFVCEGSELPLQDVIWLCRSTSSLQWHTAEWR